MYCNDFVNVKAHIKDAERLEEYLQVLKIDQKTFEAKLSEAVWYEIRFGKFIEKDDAQIFVDLEDIFNNNDTIKFRAHVVIPFSEIEWEVGKVEE